MGLVSTPSASAGILGASLGTVIQLAGDVGVECHRIDVSREELYTSDELFLCGTAAEITPIREVDGRKVGDDGFPVTRKLQAAYDVVVRGRNQKYMKLLDYVTYARLQGAGY